MSTRRTSSPAQAPAAGASFSPEMSIEEIFESPLNPRKHFSDESLAELAASIKAQGIVTPVLVRPRREGGYELAAGHRRRRAAIKAGLKMVPALIREMSDQVFLEVLTVENLQREDVHPLEEADGYRLLLENWRSNRGEAKGTGPVNLKADVEKLADRIGKSTSYVYGRLKLNELLPEGREALLSGAIQAGHAERIARLGERDQKRALETATVNSNYPISVRALGEWIERHVYRELSVATFKISDKALLEEAGACTACPKREGNRCTDSRCFEAKTKAAIDAKVAKGAILLSSGYIDDPAILRRDRFVVLTPKNKCGLAKPGVWGDGCERGKEVQVCVVKSKCPLHWSRAEEDRQEADRYAEENRLRRAAEEKERRFRDALLEAVVRGLPESPSSTDPFAWFPVAHVVLSGFVSWGLESCLFDGAEDLVLRLVFGQGEEEASGQDHPYETLAAALQEASLGQILRALAVASAASGYASELSSRVRHLGDIARAIGLDVPLLRKSLEEEEAVQASAPKRRSGGRSK